MNQICILYYCYRTINAGTIRSIRSKNKLDIFIANWSYSYEPKRVFTTYQRMRANRTFWAGTSLQHSQFLRLKFSLSHRAVLRYPDAIVRRSKKPLNKFLSDLHISDFSNFYWLSLPKFSMRLIVSP